MIISHDDAVILVLASGTVKAEIRGDQGTAHAIPLFKKSQILLEDFSLNFLDFPKRKINSSPPTKIYKHFKYTGNLFMAYIP